MKDHKFSIADAFLEAELRDYHSLSKEQPIVPSETFKRSVKRLFSARPSVFFRGLRH